MKKRTNLTEILLQTKNRKGNADVIFLVLVMLLGGLLLFDYGAHLDQRSEQEILYSNLVSYFEVSI